MKKRNSVVLDLREPILGSSAKPLDVRLFVGWLREQQGGRRERW
jgi:hypothetical protein